MSNSVGTVTSVAVELTVTSAQGVSPAAAVRFLGQSSFGPTSVEVASVEQMGFPAYINAQFTPPMSTYPDPATGVTSLLSTQQVLFTNALTGKDQLRQRVAFALSELWVTSGFTIPPQGMAPYMRLLLQDAFVNYRTIMAPNRRSGTTESALQFGWRCRPISVRLWPVNHEAPSASLGGASVPRARF